MKERYMDNAATTAVSQAVKDRVDDIMKTLYYNPSSIYEGADQAKAVVDGARQTLADLLGAQAREIYFTSGGTESDNWAIKGVAYKAGKGHIITSAIEHHAVLHTCQYLEKKGFDVTYLAVDQEGMISLEELKASLREDTILISIMAANNEIGTIQPLEAIGSLAREHGIPFHTDAVQAFGKMDLDVKKNKIDLLSVSGHKLHGLKGAGALYVRKGIQLEPLLHGGAQERRKRPGTENVSGIAALEEASIHSYQDRDKKNERLARMRDRLVKGVVETVPHAWLNGHPTKRLAGNANISFEFIEGESLLMLLEQKGILASSGSACTSGSLDPSHVLLAIGLPHEKAHGSLRISLDDQTNTEEDVDYLLEVLPPIVAKLREMSPLYEDHLQGR